jgi:hypothetical protein
MGSQRSDGVAKYTRRGYTDACAVNERAPRVFQVTKAPLEPGSGLAAARCAGSMLQFGGRCDGQTGLVDSWSWRACREL